MSKKLKIFLLTISVILIIIISLIVYFVKNNTSLLNFSISEEQIEENNSNQNVNDNFSNLIEKELQVPEKYKIDTFEKERNLNLAEGFEISLFASGLKSPRFFTFDDEGNLYVTDKGSGKLILIKDNDKDNVADKIMTIDEGLDNPHGIDLYKNDLYVGEQTQIVVYRDIDTGGNYSEKEVLVNNLPSGGHSTRTVVIGPDEKMYVSVGSSCNICEEDDDRRAAIVRYNLDGSGEEIYSEGLRNTVGFEFWKSPESDDYQIWSVDNGRDMIGDDLPPEEVNIIEEGKHYGWPYCYGDGIANPEYPDREDFCKNDTQFPVYNMQAHSAPLDITFVPKEGGNQKVIFPDALSEDTFISFHGSWNRTVPTGYKIVRINTENENAEPVNFITGWLDENGDVWGRPVGLGFDSEGAMYIADDKAGAIYKVTYNPLNNEINEKKSFTMSEVNQHDSKDDCWMVIGSGVYDVTGFIDTHPGGDAILVGCGIEATKIFKMRQMGSGTDHSSSAYALLEEYYIGDFNY